LRVFAVIDNMSSIGESDAVYSVSAFVLHVRCINLATRKLHVVMITNPSCAMSFATAC